MLFDHIWMPKGIKMILEELWELTCKELGIEIATVWEGVYESSWANGRGGGSTSCIGGPEVCCVGASSKDLHKLECGDVN